MFSEYCDRLQNRLIFPAISSIFICLLYYVDQGYYRMIFAGFFCFFLMKEGKWVASICMLCSILVLISCWIRETEPIDFKNKTEIVGVISDSIKINGDKVTFFGKTSKQQKIQLDYQLDTQQERDSFIQFTKQTVQLKVTGEYQALEKKRNEFAFDQKMYFKNHRINGRLKITTIQTVSKKTTWQDFLIRKRGEFTRGIEERFQPKTSVYMNALLFGYKDHRFIESEPLFRETGLLHLFSLSGMHIQYFLGSMYYFFRRGGFRLSVSFLPLAFLTIGYAILAGSSISVLRASYLFLLKLTLKLLKIKLSSLDCFSLTLWIILLLEPLALFQVGGQLSVLISFFFVQLSSNEQPRDQGLRRLLLFTFAVFPLTAWHFYEWPILGSFFTLLFSPLFISFFLPSFVLLFLFGNFFPSGFLEWLESSIHLLERLLGLLDFSNVITGRPPIFLVFFVIVYVLWLNEKKSEQLLLLLGKTFIVPILLVGTRYFQLESSVSFIDVGQGDSMVLTAPRHQETVVIDTGGIFTFEKEEWQKRTTRPFAEYNLVPFLKGKGISRIDKLILTHDDIDHIGELRTLAKHFSISKVYIGWGAGRAGSLKTYLTDLEKKGTTIYEVRQTDCIEGYFDFLVMSPDKKGQGMNEDSIALSMTYKRYSFLFLGDLDKQSEEGLGAKYPELRADVVKLGHHGSETSSSINFLEQLKPTYGVISCGQNNRYGHPHAEVLQGLDRLQITILRTDTQGSIIFSWHPFWAPKGRIETMLD